MLDDISPLRQLATGAVSENGTILYAPRNSKRWAASPGFGGGAQPGRNFVSAGGLSTSFEQITTSEGKPKNVSLDRGDNPPDGVLINYYLTEAPKEPITLRILDGEGNLVREFSSKELDEKEYKAVEELVEELKLRLAGSDSRLVVIRADRDARHGDLTDLMGRAKEAGAHSLTIATEALRERK